MQSSSYTIRGTVGAGILHKADRLFRNDDLGIFVELLQNSRRAGATLVEVGIEPRTSGGCIVTVQDNGTGIASFEQLLMLGESGWNADTRDREDPAGMGFYCLCLSGVEVYSGDQYANITPDAFLGKAEAIVERRSEYVEGTRLRFARAAFKDTLGAAVRKAAEFYPLEVQLNGESLPRYDFLEGAIHREFIDGIEVGFSTGFLRDWNYYSDDKNWNFYGARIHRSFPSFEGILAEAGQRGSLPLHARFDVLQTGHIKLQLPDRRNVIEDEFLAEFERKAKAAAYRCFQKQPRHALPFNYWKEAKELGVPLPEAAPLLTSWLALANDSDAHQMFGEDFTSIVPDLKRVMLVDNALANPHTLQGALHSGAKLEHELFREHFAFQGYSWYDALPTLTDAEVKIDGIPSETYLSTNQDARPSKIDVVSTIQESGHEDRLLSLPALIHVDSEELNNPLFIAVKNSPWDNDQLAGPFAIDEFLIYATFSFNDEGDTWQTQMDYYETDIKRSVNEYFRGPRAGLVALLQGALGWDASNLASRLNVSQIVLKRDPLNKRWDVELAGADGRLL